MAKADKVENKDQKVEKSSKKVIKAHIQKRKKLKKYS
jgi:small subunit ribosomal protein S11